MFCSLQPHELASCQSSLSFTIFWSFPKLISTESMMPSNHLIFCCPLLLLPSTYNLLKYFLIPFLFVVFFSGPYNFNVGTLNVVTVVAESVLISFVFSLFCSASAISTILSPSSLVCFSASDSFLFVLSSVF